MPQVGTSRNASFFGNLGNTFSAQNTQMAMAQMASQATMPAKTQPGTLIIQDTFVPSSAFDPEIPHGISVRKAAQDQGFQGPVLSHERPFETGAQTQASMRAAAALSGKPMNKEQALAAISSDVANNQAGFVNAQSSYLEGLSKGQVENSVVNLSLADSKASQLFHQVKGLSPDLQPASQGSQAGPSTKLQNYAKAFGLDAEKLRSSDKSVHGPERQKLLQGLSDHISGTLDNDPGVKAAKTRWDGATKTFEAKNNSVVVSSGNEGDMAEFLQGFGNGQKFNVPSDFEKNALENSTVTSVGATRWFEKGGKLQERVAGYSSQTPEVDIHASGSLGHANPNKADTWGTSFAAPRVAANMAELHRQNPSMSSAQVETLMKNRLTHNLNSSSGSVQVLDYSKSFEFLRNSKY